MAVKTKPTAKPKSKPVNLPKENRMELPILAGDEEAARKRIAELYLHPSINATRLILAYNPNSSLDLVETCGIMKEHATAVNNGDLSQAETS